MTVNDLLIRIAAGDNNAFEKLYLMTRRGVYAFLYTYLNDHHDTEDAMQTVYLKIKRSIHLYRSGSNGRAWVLEIAKNHALNVIKQKGRLELVEDDDKYPHSEPDTSFIITELMEKVLTEEERRIIVLHVLWGYKHREIANGLGVSTGTVTSKYKRAIDKLKREIKEASK